MSTRSLDRPVVLIGGFATPTLALRPLARRTRQLGYTPTIACHHLGLDCSERSYAGLLRVLRRVTEDCGEPAWLVAHSRGGQVARVLATRHPELVAGLIALGSPFSEGLSSVNGYTQARIRTLARFGSAGVPKLVTLDCLNGSCCTEFWRDLNMTWPDPLPFLAVYAERDRVVRWRDALDPAARTVTVPGTHTSLLTSRHSLRAVADGLEHSSHLRSRPRLALRSG